jgi:hypothetical protein
LHESLEKLKSQIKKREAEGRTIGIDLAWYETWYLALWGHGIDTAVFQNSGAGGFDRRSEGDGSSLAVRHCPRTKNASPLAR